MDKYGISAPWYKDSGIEKTAFNCYAMECSSREQKIEAVINSLVAAGPIKCNDFSTQCEIYDKVGIDSDTFTNQEMRYIESEVAKRL